MSAELKDRYSLQLLTTYNTQAYSGQERTKDHSHRLRRRGAEIEIASAMRSLLATTTQTSNCETTPTRRGGTHFL